MYKPLKLGEKLRSLRKVGELHLELGCGRRKRELLDIGIDINYYPGVDVVCDLNHEIPFGDNSVDGIYCSDFIEHIKDSIGIMKEIWRVLRHRGMVEIIVPSTDGRGAFQDATHVSFWNEGSFGYWIDRSIWADEYRGICLFELVDLRTIGLNPDGSVSEESNNPVKHVKAVLRTVKDSGWFKEYFDRTAKQLMDKDTVCRGRISCFNPALLEIDDGS